MTCMGVALVWSVLALLWCVAKGHVEVLTDLIIHHGNIVWGIVIPIQPLTMFITGITVTLKLFKYYMNGPNRSSKK